MRGSRPAQNLLGEWERSSSLGPVAGVKGSPEDPLETRGPEFKVKSAHMVTSFSNHVQLCGTGVE